MPRKGENIYKRKDGRWEGRYIVEREVSGRTKYRSVYAPTYKEVRKKRMEQILKMQKNREPEERKCDRQFDEILYQWLELARPRLKESSYNKYLNLIEVDIIPYLGRKKTAELTMECIQDYINLLLEGDSRSAPLSVRTVRDILSLMKRVLRSAAGMEYPVIFDSSVRMLSGKPVSADVLTKSEYEMLVAYLSQTKYPWEAGILLTLFTGLRIGEVCALTWDKICLEKRQIIVDSTLQRIQDKSGQTERKTRITITDPKSFSSARTIPLPDFLVSYLEHFYSGSGTYFLTGCGKFMEPRTLGNHLKRVLNVLSMRHIHFHTLRHTFATFCVESGFDIKSLSEILGHSSVNITLNRYVHPSEELKRNYMERLSVLFTVK